MSKITPEILAKQEGVTVDRIRQRWNENYAKGTFDRFAELSPEQVAALSRKKRGEKKRAQSKKRQSWSEPNGAKFAEGLRAFHAQYPPEENDLTETIIRTTETISVNQPLPPTPGDDTPPARQGWTWRDALLIGLMIAPTAASVENMYSVTFSLSASAHSAVFLTAVLSVSALGFVIAGVRNWYTVGLAALLITYESFCNLTRIYGGLMGNGNTGNPTRFLGTVTDIFGTGTHGTAIFLGAFTAFFIAAVQYAAVFELNKK